MIQSQKGKYTIPVKNEIRYYTGEPSEDVVKNLFKILCGVMNMRLSQRGINPLDEKILTSYMDAINFNIQDNDLIVLNQMASIKSLTNRKAFSINDRQISEIHLKFINFYENRKSTSEFTEQIEFSGRKEEEQPRMGSEARR